MYLYLRKTFKCGSILGGIFQTWDDKGEGKVTARLKPTPRVRVRVRVRVRGGGIHVQRIRHRMYRHEQLLSMSAGMHHPIGSIYRLNNWPGSKPFLTV